MRGDRILVDRGAGGEVRSQIGQEEPLQSHEAGFARAKSRGMFEASSDAGGDSRDRIHGHT